MELRTTFLALAFTGYLACAAAGHDTWVQTNTNLVRVEDAVYIDLMLGNHGNDHRDFKLASKIGLEGSTLEVITPKGRKYDLKSGLIDRGYAPKEGYWSGRFVPADAGLYTVAHTADSVHHQTRGIKSAKCYLVVSPSLDLVSSDHGGFDRPLGHPLEFIAEKNPVAPMGPGLPIAVRLLYRGKPLADARVSFVPRGQELTPEFDPRYERMTDAEGRASFTPTEGDLFLVVAHHVEPEEKGNGYNQTKYAATMTVFVPQVCPCCE